MKKIVLICIALLLPVAALAWMNVTTVGGGGVPAEGVTYPGFTHDVYEDFEDALAGSWSEVDSSGIINPQDSAAEYRGTYGMSVATGSSAESWVVYDFGATPRSSFSVGFWMKSGTYDSYAGDRWVFIAYNNAQGNLLIFREGNSAGDDSRRVSWSLDADTVTIADATWYWVTIKVVKNGTCSAAIYNTSGTQVGSTMSGTLTDYAIDYIVIGTYSTATNTAVYYDDFFIDYTDATFPLGPPSGS